MGILLQHPEKSVTVPVLYSIGSTHVNRSVVKNSSVYRMVPAVICEWGLRRYSHESVVCMARKNPGFVNETGIL
jgi:hypothetical protein